MGARHRQRKSDQAPVATESRELRQARHRAQRHHVHQTLHEVPVDELDDVVLPEPKATRERIEPAERDDVKTATGRTFKPWKQPFWKRRTNARRAKAEAWESFAAGD